MGRIDGDDPDVCIFSGDNIPGCDRALLFNALCHERYVLSLNSLKYEPSRSLIDELELRGYDLDTIKFTIEKKKK